jgi:hypothetical protein
MVVQFFDPHKTILEIRMVTEISYVVLGLMDKVSHTHTHTHTHTLSLSLSLALSLSLTHTHTHLKKAFPLVKRVNSVRAFLPHNATTVES